jgi:recombination protein RecT
MAEGQGTAVAKVSAKALMERETKGTFRHEVARILTAAAEVMPKHMTPERMLSLVYAAATKTPKLFDCTTASLGMCLMTCAEMGLEPGQAGHVYLIPRFNSKTNAMECTILVGYKGLCELARRSSQVATLDAVPV